VLDQVRHTFSKLVDLRGAFAFVALATPFPIAKVAVTLFADAEYFVLGFLGAEFTKHRFTPVYHLTIEQPVTCKQATAL
jgi:hypothetical protein